MTPARREPTARPFPLRLSAGLVVAQGSVLVVYAVLEAASVSAGRVTMGVTTAALLRGVRGGPGVVRLGG